MHEKKQFKVCIEGGRGKHLTAVSVKLSHIYSYTPTPAFPSTLKLSSTNAQTELSTDNLCGF
jgi:hypothetical protein